MNTLILERVKCNECPLERLTIPHRLGDTETFAQTWDDFEPAVPLNAPGAVAAGARFFGGWAIIGGLLALIAWPLRRRVIA